MFLFYRNVTMLQKIFGARQVQPPKTPTDEVVPFHLIDGMDMYRSITLAVTFRIHDVLDTKKLYHSLCTLIESDGWKRVGGRVRKNVSV